MEELYQIIGLGMARLSWFNEEIKFNKEVKEL